MTAERVAAELAVLELEVGIALRAAGIPPDVARAPFPHELASRTDFAGLDRRIQLVGEALGLAAVRGRAELVDLIEAELLARARAGATREALVRYVDRLYEGSARPPWVRELTGRVEGLVRATLSAVVAEAVRDVVVELDAQGLTADAAELRAAREEVDRRRRAVAIEAAQHAIRSVHDAAHNAPSPPPGGGSPARDAERFVVGLAAAAREAKTGVLRSAGDRAVTSVQGTARVGALAQVRDPVLIYASELLDRRTCDPCGRVDGREYASWAAALVDYPAGQYRDCEGGDRCRGTLVTVSAREPRATVYDV